MKNYIFTGILAATALVFGIANANDYKDLVKKNAPDAQIEIPQQTAPETPKAPRDYSQNPVIHWEEKDWKLTNTDAKGEKHWMNMAEIDPIAEKSMIVGMIEFPEDKIIPGVGAQVRMIFSEAIVDCPTGMVYPYRDTYTTFDRHIIGMHRVAIPQGAAPISDYGPLSKMVCQKQ